MKNIINFVLYSDDDSDNNNDDDNNFDIIERLRPIPIFRVRHNYFEILSEKQFIDRFRFSKNSTLLLLHRLIRHFELFTERNNAVRPMTQLLVTLRFCATGNFYITIGDFVGISKSTVFKIIHSLCRTIASWRHEFIYFPRTPRELLENQVQFYQTARFIQVIGCIDCKHVKVGSFGGNDAEIYRNRKGSFSINVQVICNAHLEIIDIVARWPGSTHDATIFLNSRIRDLFENNPFGDALLLGDSGYQIHLIC
ncbi:putative nuclease HARBI1 isoform X2 [Cotesia glomerata]|uniref:putative nuclease HARBI1 isoform X2 n=1 Tax=Cotesia glomerata TaxID=32391 RepID=UPI001D005EBF|nr:putative nuclease HARBI1 isoform X2 [Cotesia glomerata]